MPIRTPNQQQNQTKLRIGTESAHDVELICGDEVVATVDLATKELRFPAGVAAAATVLGFGAQAGEGLAVKAIDQTVSLAGNAALFKALTTPIPAGAVILSATANIEAALTGGGTTVKVGLGPNATDPDKYGLSSALTKNAKFGKIPAWAVLASPEAIDICACATAGGAGNTALTVGSVRVRIIYLQARDLANA
jgi:hypothetical protein